MVLDNFADVVWQIYYSGVQYELRAYWRTAAAAAAAAEGDGDVNRNRTRNVLCLGLAKYSTVAPSTVYFYQ